MFNCGTGNCGPGICLFLSTAFAFYSSSLSTKPYATANSLVILATSLVSSLVSSLGFSLTFGIYAIVNSVSALTLLLELTLSACDIIVAGIFFLI